VSFDYASMPSSSTSGSVLRLDHDFEIDPCVENAGSHAHAHGLTFRCDLGYMHLLLRFHVGRTGLMQPLNWL
jgi:hypothetical protein